MNRLSILCEELNREKKLQECYDKGGIENLVKKIKKLACFTSEVMEELECYKEKAEKLQKELKKCKETKQELEAELEECWKNNKRLQKGLEECCKKAKELQKEFEAELENVKKKIAELEKELENVKQKNAELEKELEECKNKVKSFKTVSFNRIVDKDWIPSGICSIASDKQGNLYIGTTSSQGHGSVYKLAAGAETFEVLGELDGEVWGLGVADDGTVYAGLRTGAETGGVYQCLPETEVFVLMDGLDKSCTSISFDEEGNIYALGWTGEYIKDSTDKTTYKCLKGETTFKPVE